MTTIPYPRPGSRIRRFALPAFLAIAATALVGFMVVRPTTDYRIPVADLQSKIDAKMPITGEKMRVHYTISDVRLALVDEGKATLDARIGLEGFGREVEFEATGTGVPSYRDGGFYLADVTIDRAELLRLEEKYGTVGTIGRLANKLLEKGILTGDQVEAAKAKAREMTNEALAAQLEARPIYRLDNGTLKGEVAALALRDLRVDAGGVTVTLDPFGALAKIVLYVLAGLLALAAMVGAMMAFLNAGSGSSRGAGSGIISNVVIGSSTSFIPD